MLKDLKKLDKKRDGKTFFGLFNKKSETADNATNAAIDNQRNALTSNIEQAGEQDQKAIQNFNKYGLFNKGNAGMTPGSTVKKEGTPGGTQDKTYKPGDDTAGDYDPNSGKFVPSSQGTTETNDEKMSDKMDLKSSNPVPSNYSKKNRAKAKFSMKGSIYKQ